MSEKEALIEKINAQITEEEKYSGYLGEAGQKFRKSKPFVWIALCLLIAVVLLQILVFDISIDVFLITWIGLSFIFYMFYFFLLMLPSLGTTADIKLFSSDFITMIKQFTKLASMLKTLTKNPLTFAGFFWSAFLINTKALAPCFMVIFGIDAICAAILAVRGSINTITLLLILAQVVLIFIYYGKILHSKPGSPGFFLAKNIPGKEKTHFYLLKKINIAGYVILFLVITCLVLAGGLLLPGMTFGRFVDTLTTSPMHYPVLIVITGLFMLLYIRYVQGKASKRLMEKLNQTHLQVLKSDLLVRVKKAEPEQISNLKREFLLLSMNKLMVQEFLNLFPVYSLMPNILIVFEPEAREILTEKREDTKLRDLL